MWKDLTATYIDYVNWIYITWDIDETLVKSSKTDYRYHIHRNVWYYYGSHDPERIINTDAEWKNTLTIDKLWWSGRTWAFAPINSTSNYRWYSLNGDLKDSSENFAWTIWVRRWTDKFLIWDNGWFRWNDGSYWTSCDDYKNSSDYDWEGEWFYWVKPDSNPATKVYCDIENYVLWKDNYLENWDFLDENEY